MCNEGTWTIGSIVKMLREEQGITGAQLSCGLCSTTALSRIEAGEREMNMIFSMLLFGRLGYHPDKFELYGSNEEYIQYEQRESMEKLKKQGDYRRLEQEITQYQKAWSKEISTDSIQQQFVKSMEGFLCLQRQEYERSVELLKQALTLTVSEWNGDWLQNTVLSETELEIMGRLADAFEGKGSCQEAYKLRLELYTYLEQKPSNKRQMLGIYTETICRLVPMMLEQKNMGQGLELCEGGLRALSESGRMYHWPELLYWKGRCLEELYKMEQADKTSIQEVYIRAFYIYRLFKNYEMADSVKQRLDKEVPGWEYIELAKL